MLFRYMTMKFALKYIIDYRRVVYFQHSAVFLASSRYKKRSLTKTCPYNLP